MTRFTKTFAALTIVLCLGVALSGTATAKKKSGFKTGTYTATGDVTFKFKVFKATCYSPKLKKQVSGGYCFTGTTRPKVAMDCTDVPDNLKDYETLLSVPANVSIPKSGKMTHVLNSYAGPNVQDITTFKLTLGTKGKATGSIESAAVNFHGKPVDCKSGLKKFSAKR